MFDFCDLECLDVSIESLGICFEGDIVAVSSQVVYKNNPFVMILCQMSW